MNAILIATLAGLMTAICWGASDWLSARASKKISPFQINFAGQISGAVVALFIFLFSGLEVPSAAQIIRIVIGDSLILTGYIIFIKALSKGALGVIVPIGNSFPVVTLLLSIALLNQHLSLQQLAAIIIVVAGSAVLAYEKNHKKLPLRELHKDTLLAIIASLIWGVGFFVINPLVDEIRWQDLTIISQISAVFYGALVLAVASRKNFIHSAKQGLNSRIALIAGGAGTLGIAFLYLGSNHAGSVIIPAVLSSCAPLVASFLGAIMDKEKIGWIKRAGAVTIVAGIIILNIA